MIDAVIREIVADIDYYGSTVKPDEAMCLPMKHFLRWRTGLRAVLELSDADELARLKSVDAAAREYAEAVNAWPDIPHLPGHHWLNDVARAHARQQAAQDALLALYAPESPVVSPEPREGGD